MSLVRSKFGGDGEIRNASSTVVESGHGSMSLRGFAASPFLVLMASSHVVLLPEYTLPVVVLIE